MGLLEEQPELDLYDRDWLIHTRSEERAPAQDRADGAGPPQPDQPRLRHQRDGREQSVLSPGVRVDVGAVVRDSIIMFDTVIRAGAVVDRAIIDKEVVVGPGAVVGDGTGRTAQQPGAGPAEHRHHGRRQARQSSRAVSASAATSGSTVTPGRPTFPAATSAVATRSCTRSFPAAP